LFPPNGKHLKKEKNSLSKKNLREGSPSLEGFLGEKPIGKGGGGPDLGGEKCFRESCESAGRLVKLTESSLKESYLEENKKELKPRRVSNYGKRKFNKEVRQNLWEDKKETLIKRPSQTGTK